MNYADTTLSELENRELSAITFVRGYIQLHFDGPLLNLYVWPTLNNTLGQFQKDSPGYRDLLCGQIGSLVVAATVDPARQIALHFDNGTVISISLRREDRVGEEAAMFQDGTHSHWNVW